MNSLNIRIAFLSDRIASLSDRTASLSDKIRVLSDRIMVLSDRIAVLSDRIASLSDRIASLSDRIRVLSDRIRLLCLVMLGFKRSEPVPRTLNARTRRKTTTAIRPCTQKKRRTPQGTAAARVGSAALERSA
jgi:uncharacterized coiled-coil protein SlyX